MGKDLKENVWSIRGISLNTKEHIMKLAKEDNLFVGEWLERLLLEYIKNRRSKGRSVAVTREKKPIDIEAARNFLLIVKEMGDSGIDVADNVKKNTNLLLNKMAIDIRKGVAVNLPKNTNTNDEIVDETTDKNID